MITRNWNPSYTMVNELPFLKATGFLSFVFWPKGVKAGGPPSEPTNTRACRDNFWKTENWKSDKSESKTKGPLDTSLPWTVISGLQVSEPWLDQHVINLIFKHHYSTTTLVSTLWKLFEPSLIETFNLHHTWMLL